MRQVLMAGILVLLSACSSDSTPVNNGPADLSGIPKTSDPVSAGTSSIIRQPSRTATTGLILTGNAAGSVGATSWTAKSRAFCEAANSIRNVYANTSSGDHSLCYVGVLDKYQFLNSPYDGNTHYVHLTNMTGGVTDGYVQFVVTKTEGAITAATIWSCFASGPSQDAYDNTTITGNSVVKASSSNKTVSGIVTQNLATTGGLLNASAQWVKKTINSATNASSGVTWSYSQSATILQNPTNLVITGYNTFSGGGQTVNYQFGADVDILNSNSMATFAVGDGSAHYVIAPALASPTTPITSFTSTDSWSGDTAAKLGSASSGAYFTTVGTLSLPPVGTPVTGIQSSQVWNCTVPPGFAFQLIDFNTVLANPQAKADLAACDTVYQLNQSTLPVCYNGG